MSAGDLGNGSRSQTTEDIDFNDIANFSTWVLRNPDVSDDETIYIDATNPSSTLTRGEVFKSVCQLAAGLRHENHDEPLHGATVCLHTFNDIWYPVLIHGILASGGCYTGTNPAYTVHELQHHFRTTNTKFIITGLKQADIVLTAAETCGIPKSRVFVIHEPSDPKPPRVRSHGDLFRHGMLPLSSFNSGRPASPTSPPPPAVLMSTSGTSGLPKFAARTHASLIAECAAIASHDIVRKSYQERRLITVPIFHAFALPLAVMSALRSGIPTYISPRFEPDLFLNTVHQHAITEVPVAPPVLLLLLAKATSDPGARVKEKLASLRTVWCGGAPLGRGTQERVQRELLSGQGQARVAQVWGMTECGWVSTLAYPETDSTGSVGRLLPGCEARIAPCEGPGFDDGNTSGGSTSFSSSLTSGTDTTPSIHQDTAAQPPHGEILLKSPWRMTAYLSNRAANSAAFTEDGWYRTGDIGYIDIGGKVHLIDRAKDLIKVKGWQVSPSELEAVLLRHALVTDAAVVGVSVDGDTLEEVPRAFVVVKHPGLEELGSQGSADSTGSRNGRGSSSSDAVDSKVKLAQAVAEPSNHELHRPIDATQIKAWMAKFLARYKWATMEVVFVDEGKGERIPKSASGKILRRVLAREGVLRAAGGL